jgi:hypothetical protein
VLHPRIDLQPASLKDSRHDRGMTEAEQVARMTSSAGTCGARSCSDSVDWASYERICNPDAISRRGSQAGIDGCLRITKIQGITVGRLASEVI